MRVGINYAWKNYGWDFGLPPQNDSGCAWGPRAAWRETFEAELAEFVDLGIFCIRWFLLGDGTTYGTDSLRPHLDSRGNGQWRFDDPPALSAEFLEDFAQLLQWCESAGILLLPSLLDFHFCFPGISVSGAQGVIKGGRSDVILDSYKRSVFYERVLKPLLKVASLQRNVIYAIELLNEPEWCTRHPTLPTQIFDERKTVPRDEMRTFLRDGASIINDSGFASTVGFANYQTLLDWDVYSLGLTLHQFHYYAEPDLVPPYPLRPRFPLIVGEFATALHRPWLGLGPAQDLLMRLRHLEEKGYPAAFLWSANRAEEKSADPPAVDFSESSRDLIRKYTGRE